MVNQVKETLKHNLHTIGKGIDSSFRALNYILDNLENKELCRDTIYQVLETHEKETITAIEKVREEIGKLKK